MKKEPRLTRSITYRDPAHMRYLTPLFHLRTEKLYHALAQWGCSSHRYRLWHSDYALALARTGSYSDQ